MDKIVTALQGRQKATQRLTRKSPLFKTIVNAVKEKKGENIVSLDLKKIDEAVADYFVLCEAQSSVQVKAIADYVTEQVFKVCNEKPYHIEKGTHWTLLDYVNIVVHIFQHDYREFYDLESLWEDAESMEHIND